jgi:hypothetical protein
MAHAASVSTVELRHMEGASLETRAAICELGGLAARIGMEACHASQAPCHALNETAEHYIFHDHEKINLKVRQTL